jgi:hypothetical protein
MGDVSVTIENTSDGELGLPSARDNQRQSNRHHVTIQTDSDGGSKRWIRSRSAQTLGENATKAASSSMAGEIFKSSKDILLAIKHVEDVATVGGVVMFGV